MSKLYTVKEMAELLNAEYGDNPANYEFTEERIRARLRSSRARGTITPKHMGYDRRTNYYSEEDFAKLKASWLGPELPEFTEHPEDLQVIDPETEEVYIRPAKVTDAEDIFNLLPAFASHEEAESVRNYVSKMLKASQYANFVSTVNDEDVSGWAQAEISAAASIVEGTTTGIIRVYVAQERRDHVIAARSLIYRAESWLVRFNANRVIVEVPASLVHLRELLTEKMHFNADRTSLTLAKDIAR